MLLQEDDMRHGLIYAAVGLAPPKARRRRRRITTRTPSTRAARLRARLSGRCETGTGHVRRSVCTERLRR